MLYVFVDDVNAHYNASARGGARIVVEPHTHAGDRRYQVTDPEGHQWTFAQRVGASVQPGHTRLP